MGATKTDISFGELFFCIVRKGQKESVRNSEWIRQADLVVL